MQEPLSAVFTKLSSLSLMASDASSKLRIWVSSSCRFCLTCVMYLFTPDCLSQIHHLAHEAHPRRSRNLRHLCAFMLTNVVLLSEHASSTARRQQHVLAIDRDFYLVPLLYIT
jgi:hypothetical protein